MTLPPGGRPAENGGAAPRRSPSPLRPALVVALLLLAVAAVHGQTLYHPFFHHDDGALVSANRALRAGFSWDGIRYALTTRADAGWIPVTWLSRLLDVSLYGTAPWGHHLGNVLLHGLNATLLFLLLRRATGRLPESALAAALFALHPLQVEAVAWVTERKGLLAAAFALASLLAFLRFAEAGGRGRYGAFLLLFALALLSKPVVATLPLVLLLLDAWPLGRLRGGAPAPGEPLPGCALPPPPPRPLRTLLWEAAAPLLLSAAAVAFTFADEAATGVVAGEESLPFRAAAANALVSTAAHLGKAAWPAGLSVFYPHPGTTLPAWKAAGAALLLGALTAGAVRWRRRLPHLAFGWGWFLALLLPVSGIVQAGAQGRADRYLYLPVAGLAVAFAWSAASAATRLRVPPAVSAAVAAALLLALGVGGHGQASLWADPELLLRRSLAATEGNWFLEDSLGNVLLEKGRDGEAERHLREALRLRPDLGGTRAVLGRSLARQGRPAEAEGEYREALRLDPSLAEARNNLGLLLARSGRAAEAEAEYREALRLRPEGGEAAYNLALLLAGEGRDGEAEGLFRAALRSEPEDGEAHDGLGRLLARSGRVAEAEGHFREAVRLRPGSAGARANLGLLLLGAGRAGEAEGELREAVRLDPSDADCRNNLGVLLASLGRTGEAEGEFREALRRHPGHPGASANLARLGAPRVPGR